jgi:hypothetical protein
VYLAIVNAVRVVVVAVPTVPAVVNRSLHIVVIFMFIVKIIREAAALLSLLSVRIVAGFTRNQGD